MSERSHVDAQVELMPLPEDVPDEQTVVCGSKSGTFLTRTQRVVLDGVEMSASRFEQVRCTSMRCASLMWVRMKCWKLCAV